tara:strand:+ start:419 stop:694 length:276 start_codon:yes stop_codon:yes gene_type:complete
MQCIVKRKGHEEAFDEKKVYASVYAAVINCEHSEEEAEQLAKQVMKKVLSWVKKEGKKKVCIDSHEIKKFVLKLLTDKHVRLMYNHHTDVC